MPNAKPEKGDETDAKVGIDGGGVEVVPKLKLGGVGFDLVDAVEDPKAREGVEEEDEPNAKPEPNGLAVDAVEGASCSLSALKT